MRQQPFASPEEALEHYGVKGMRWGVRKKDETSDTGRSQKPSGPSRTGLSQTPPGSAGGGSSKKPPDTSGKLSAADAVKLAEYRRLSEGIVAKADLNPHLMQAKYGPPRLQRQIEQQHQADREKLKKVALGVGIGVGVAAAGIAVYKLNQSGGGVPGLPGLPTDKDKLKVLLKTNSKAYNHAVDGLHINWENGVDLPSGSIIRRLSSVAETTPRPDGFFGSHLEGDVQSYKAILPTFWKQWGVGSAEAGGVLNHYQAKGAIRAPSGKDSFEAFKKLINTDDAFNKDFISFWDANGLRGKSDVQLRRSFTSFSQMFVDSKDPTTKRYFEELGKRGYNAVIDFNDAGKLGKTPLRVFDGKMFDIVKNEKVGLDDFYEAAKTWSPELVHILEIMGNSLVHYTVKGRDTVSRILAQNGNRRLSKSKQP